MPQLKGLARTLKNTMRHRPLCSMTVGPRGATCAQMPDHHLPQLSAVRRVGLSNRVQAKCCLQGLAAAAVAGGGEDGSGVLAILLWVTTAMQMTSLHQESKAVAPRARVPSLALFVCLNKPRPLL